MRLAQPIADIEYPETDGKPMAETDLHLQWMIDIRSMLKHRYRGQRVYVGANMLVYYVEGNPRKSVAPDGFVVKDCEQGLRRTFKTWDEGRTPDVVFEVTSNHTRREDERTKPAIYAKMGVKELFLYDPTGDYIDPPLTGFRFTRGRMTRIRGGATGALECLELGLLLRLDDRGGLQVSDAHTNLRLLTEAEAAQREAERARTEREIEQAAREAAQTAREAAQEALEAEQTAREAAQEALEAEQEAREAAEADVRRLREELDRERRKRK